jgi:hypothetical protein
VSDKDENIYGLIAGIIREETKYLRHYIGKVVLNIDAEMKGRVKCTIDELGWDNPSLAVSCYPRQMHGLSVPLINEYVEIYFMGGDPSKAVYMGIASEMINMKPSKFTFQTSHVIFEHPQNKHGLVYDELLRKYILDGQMLDIKMMGDILIDPGPGMFTFYTGSTEPATLGTKLMTWLTTFINSTFNAHTHVVAGVMPGVGSITSAVPLPTGTPPVPTDFCSTMIKMK